jgi:long-subunit acyl-CoA synthetase (AMP-forming)
MHSHRTFFSGTETIKKIFGQNSEGRFLCYLPLSHMGERVLTELHALLVGATITFNESPDTFLDDLRAVKPTQGLAVPRIWEKILQGIFTAFGNDPEQLKKQLLAEGGKELAAGIRQHIGLDKATFFLTAASLTPESTKDWYRLLGIDLTDIFGQTELFPLTRKTADQHIPGSVGAAAPDFEIRIDDNGEILGRGPCVALGYYKNPGKSAETFIDNGWVRTGDKGYLDEQGNLFIVGRIQDTFKSAKGKFVVPGPIENKFSGNGLTEQHCLYGLGLAQPVMLCTLTLSSQNEQDATIQNQLLDFTRQLNETLEPHERIGAIVISRTHWTNETNLLTHTHKIKRDQVQKYYQSSIDALAEKMPIGRQDIIFIWA